MNIYAVIILVALLVDFILKLSGNLLNLKALKLDVPPDLVGIYKPEEYRKSQQYLRATTNFSLVKAVSHWQSCWLSGSPMGSIGLTR